MATKAKDEGMSIADAAFDYSDALLNNKAQVSWESIPGRTGNHLPEMFDAPYEVQQEYHVAVSKVFLDQDGNDLVAKELGIPTPGDFEAPGYFEGKVSPGTQTELAIPKAGGTKYGAVEPGALDLMHAYAAVRGIVMKQDGVGFHRPFYNATKQDSQGVVVEIGRQFSERETKQLGEIMAELSGHTDYNPIAAPGGVRLINFAFARKNKDGSKAMEDTWFSDDMLRTNAEFYALVKQAVERLDLDDGAGVKLNTFNAQEGYVGNDWSVNKNGEDYIRGALSAGSPDLQRKVRSLITKLTARIDEVDRDFSERYGFTRNADINQEYRGQGPVADGPPQEAPDPTGRSDKKRSADSGAPEKNALTTNENLIDATGDVVVGDIVTFKQDVFGGSFRNPRYIGERIIKGEVVRDSYGKDKQQHTFTIKPIEVTGVSAEEIMKKDTFRIKGRNLYKHGTLREKRADESSRQAALDEKHKRGDAARAARDVRKNQM